MTVASAATHITSAMSSKKLCVTKSVGSRAPNMMNFCRLSLAHAESRVGYVEVYIKTKNEVLAPRQKIGLLPMSASLIGRLGSSTFRPSAAAVSMSLTGSCFSSESAPGPFHHGIRGRGGTIYQAALSSCERQVQADQTNSPHPSSREGHHSTAGWSSSFLLLRLILRGLHAAAAACSRVQRNSVPSTQMRCMITANRRARATIAFFIPRRLAICIAQALSQDHFFERSML